MEPGKYQVYAEIAKYRGGKTDDGQDRRPGSTPTAGNPGVQVSRINKPDDQRPGFFGIPAPVSTPGDIGPESARDDTDGQKRKPDGDGLVADLVQRAGVRHVAQNKAR